MSNTAVIAVGSKGNSHKIVEAAFNKDLEVLNNGVVMFVKELNKCVLVTTSLGLEITMAHIVLPGNMECMSMPT